MMTQVNKSADAALAALAMEIRSCTLCGLCLTRTNAVPGEGPRGAAVMFVGEAPGHVNDREGRPFVGKGGQIFDGLLVEIGLERRDVYISNAVKCWPPENRKPRPNELAMCREYLNRELDLVKPQLVFALGTTAYTLLTGESIKLKQEHGKIVRRGDVSIGAMFHPNGLRYIKGGRATILEDLRTGLQSIGWGGHNAAQGRLFK
ncbi:MAG: uracil-DNA glycosylase [Flavobacteriales bacterium]|nr:uracil-DNA glycosylase [Flavobacteriales bacterium]